MFRKAMLAIMTYVAVLSLIAGCASNTEDQLLNTESVLPEPSRIFLQQISFDSAIIKWRDGADSVWFGTRANQLDHTVATTYEARHKIAKLQRLKPDTRYYYSFEKAGPETAIMSFRTAPLSEQTPADGNTHIWLLGDSGTATENTPSGNPHEGEALAVKSGFLKYNEEQAGGEALDLLLLLGDNAYLEGTDEQWQGGFFDIYTELIQGAATWPTIGNHEMGVGPLFDICIFSEIPACEKGPVIMNVSGTSKSSEPNSYDSDGNGPDKSGLPYLHIFTLPTKGEIGGVPSGTEQYYSFNYGNVHVVSLDSQLTNRDKHQRETMRAWLIDDLSANTLDWTVVIFHHPPYSKGKNHDSDREQNEIDMRTNFVSIFENYGVDVVYSGHSHSYERSWYLNDHHGLSDTFDLAENAQLDAHGHPALGQGNDPYQQISPLDGSDNRAVYIVAGSSGKADKKKPCLEGRIYDCTLPDWLQHPAHRTFSDTKFGHQGHGIAVKGSVVLDVKKSTLTSRFIDEHGRVLDYFIITRN